MSDYIQVAVAVKVHVHADDYVKVNETTGSVTLFDLIHPRTVHGREMHLKARMRAKPCLHKLAMIDADVVADKVNRGHAGGALAVDRLEQLDELDLPLTAAKDASDLTGARVKRSEEVQRARQ